MKFSSAMCRKVRLVYAKPFRFLFNVWISKSVWMGLVLEHCCYFWSFCCFSFNPGISFPFLSFPFLVSVSFSNAKKIDVDLFLFFICHHHCHYHCHCVVFIVPHAETVVIRTINDRYNRKKNALQVMDLWPFHHWINY